MGIEDSGLCEVELSGCKMYVASELREICLVLKNAPRLPEIQVVRVAGRDLGRQKGMIKLASNRIGTNSTKHTEVRHDFLVETIE